MDQYWNQRAFIASEDARLEPPDEPEPPTRCDYCDRPLYEGDMIYVINGDRICKECVDSCYGEFVLDDC